jgi:hypothetical protein
MRRVLVGTPALTGSVHAWYADSMFDSIKLGLMNGVNIIPSILLDESVLPMARNELLCSAYIHNVESLIFVDSDERWQPEALLSVINSPYEVFGLPVVSKTDEYGKYNIRIEDPNNLHYDENGNLEVSGVGTGFLKIGAKALTALWDSSRELHFRGKNLRMICEYGEVGSEFVSEDYNLCRKLKDLGYGIWIDPRQTVQHTGTKTWSGNFEEFLLGRTPVGKG